MSDEIDTHPQLFILRLWRTQLPEGRVEWRGRLHHTQTNKTRYFRDWPALIPSLLAMLREANLPADHPSNELPNWQSPETHDEGEET